MNNLNDFVNSISVKMTREVIIAMELGYNPTSIERELDGGNYDPDFDELEFLGFTCKHEGYLGCEVYYDEDDDWGTHTYSRRFNSWGEARGWIDKAKKHSNMYNFDIVEG